jgi:hypothetical protein
MRGGDERRRGEESRPRPSHEAVLQERDFIIFQIKKNNEHY